MIRISSSARILVLQAFPVGILTSGVAQELHHHGNDGVSSTALLKLGTVGFPISCVAQVQVPFERGVAMLHSFWYEEARKQFASVAQTGPSCAMAHLGTGCIGNSSESLMMGGNRSARRLPECMRT